MQDQSARRARYDALRDAGKTHEEAVAEIEGSSEDRTVSSMMSAIGPKAALGEAMQRRGRSKTGTVAKAVGQSVLDLGRTAAQGIPLVGTFADEAIGTVRGAVDPSMTMEQGRKAEASAISNIRKTNPFALPVELATGLSAGKAIMNAGKIPQMIKTAVGGVSGGKVLPRIAKNAAIGAGAGVASGAGAANEGERGIGGLAGGVVGGVVGGAAPEIMALPTQIKGRLRNWLASRKPDAVAASMMGRAVDADMTNLPDAVRRAKPDDRFADIAGPFASQTLAEAGRAPSREATTTRRLLESRADAAHGAAGSALAEASGVARGEGNVRAVDDIENWFRPDIRQKFKDVMKKHEFLIDPRLQEMIDDKNPIMQRAVQDARLMVAKADNPSFVNSKGEPVDQGLEFFDALRQRLLRMSKRGEEADKVFAGLKMKKLRDTLDELVPSEYKSARDISQENTVYQKAVQLGERMATGSKDVRDVDVLLDKIGRGVSPSVRDGMRTAFREGAARSLVNQLDQVSGDAQSLLKFFQSPGAERKASLAFQDQRGLEGFHQKAKEMLRPLLVAESNAGNAQAVKYLDPDIFDRVTPWSMAQALHGNPALAVAQTIGAQEGKQFSKAQRESQPLLAKLARERVQSPEFANAMRLMDRWSPAGRQRASQAISRLSKIKQSKAGMPTRAATQAMLARLMGTSSSEQQP